MGALKSTIFPWTPPAPSPARPSRPTDSTTSAVMPPSGVGSLPPSAVTRILCEDGETISACSSPRTQCGTRTGSVRTCRPYERSRSVVQATAASAFAEPDKRGPIRSVRCWRMA